MRARCLFVGTVLLGSAGFWWISESPSFESLRAGVAGSLAEAPRADFAEAARENRSAEPHLAIDGDIRSNDSTISRAEPELLESAVEPSTSVSQSEADVEPTTSTTPCMEPSLPPALSDADAASLRAAVKKMTKKWGYEEAEKNFKPFKGLRFLDIGMGQGPMGVVAMEAGVQSYWGLDPALCINKPARTRNRRIGRTPSEGECKQLLGPTCKTTCAQYQRCMTAAAEKYGTFPFTGVQIMQAFPGKVILLPGTFETIQPTGLIKRGDFDAAGMFMVSEHLPDNRLVVEGVFQWTKPGQLFYIKHHNYYGFDGHHQELKDPSAFDPKNAAHRGVAFWSHLEPSSWIFNSSDMNRIRLGDLMALVHVYFECAWRANIDLKWAKALDDRPELLQSLERRGFAHAELLVNKWAGSCQRREEALDAPWLASRMWFHPPSDGSYSPRPFPKEFSLKNLECGHSLKKHKQYPLDGILYSPPGRGHRLAKYLSAGPSCP
ncbi:hypothetical protein AK812_SmicGene15395 [Symbiodinium microadriaticum]|uniref:Uncharacterized protein n=1 Tax=Symbiodinium microadriaticum TaxID=2951 RepID=A0A1Q9E343_SYMMI|nr:hypothetical protein AK812_SmicGene15395 [Symbiodinium microadriaticum]CAE7262703.1 unnamed protein product [Symbiodinium sp. KB8]CAE7889633.1 unnamed protein product [Symbiodinium microadriaticum]